MPAIAPGLGLESESEKSFELNVAGVYLVVGFEY